MVIMKCAAHRCAKRGTRVERRSVSLKGGRWMRAGGAGAGNEGRPEGCSPLLASDLRQHGEVLRGELETAARRPSQGQISGPPAEQQRSHAATESEITANARVYPMHPSRGLSLYEALRADVSLEPSEKSRRWHLWPTGAGCTMVRSPIRGAVLLRSAFEGDPVLRLIAWPPPLSRPRKEAMRHGSAALQASRLESLRNSLLESIDMLRRRRANEIPQGDIDDYVSLDWIEWHGGTLRLTVVGENIRRQLIRQAPRPA
ncbi:hypothetical protein AACH06_01245 [Ideonella sp. DXS29W]|uniref:Uncharacterized protein n=1 Tax=Ideonella lacteola TaxID=2984193 RepID=A0ABU9BI93_9BURK